MFATVGFGDITAKTEAARLLITGQMIIDLIIIGIGAKIILGACSKPTAAAGTREHLAPHLVP